MGKWLIPGLGEEMVQNEPDASLSVQKVRESLKKKLIEKQTHFGMCMSKGYRSQSKEMPIAEALTI